MPFLQEELVNFGFKGWLGILGTGNRNTAPDNLAWYEEQFTIDVVTKPTQVLSEIASVPPAADVITARANALANPTIIEDLSDPVDAVRLTPSPNNKVFFATSIFNDLSTRLTNWILPQLVPQASGLASIGYAARIWNGDPNAGGTEITTTLGQVGAQVEWFFNYGAGAVSFSSDENVIIDPNNLYITGFRYIGLTGGGAGGGTVTNATNIGVGEGLFSALNGTVLEFRSIQAGSTNLSVTTVGDNIVVDLDTVNISDISGLQVALDAKVDDSQLGVANGVATLDANGKLLEAQLPDLGITDTFVVADEAARLALAGSIQTGDVAVQTDVQQTFILQTGDGSSTAHWVQLLFPATVTSVNGNTGAVVLTASDIDYTPSVGAGDFYAGGVATISTKAALDELAIAVEALQNAGGGPGTITIEDEDVVIDAAVTTIDFRGTNIQAIQDSSGEVLVFSPPPAYASNFNSSNGTTDGTADEQFTVVSGRLVSGPTSPGVPFDIGPLVGGNAVDVTQNVDWIVETVEDISFPDNTTVIRVIVRDANGAVLASLDTTADSVKTNNNAQITTEILNFDPDTNQFRGQVRVSVNIANTGGYDTDGGLFSLEIQHLESDLTTTVPGAVDFSRTDLFVDVNPNAFVITNPTIVENTPVVKQLSGVNYYDLGSTFTVAISDIDFPNANSFVLDFIEVQATEYGLDDFNLEGSDLTGWTTQHDVQNASFSGVRTITAASYRFDGADANIQARTVDFVNGTFQPSSNASILIDTFVPDSDELSEFFTDEAFRRTPFDLAGSETLGVAWDSSQDLGTYNGGGNIQVIGGEALVPERDFTSFAPSNTADYSSLTGPFRFFRRFTDLAALVRGNATLTFTGSANLVNEFIAGNIVGYIYIPNRFFVKGVFSGGSLFDFGTFDTDIQNGGVYSNTPEVPMRVTSDNGAGTIQVSFGNFGLNAANNDVELYLEWTNPAITIDSIVLNF